MKGRIDQWYLFSQNETPSDIVREMDRGNEQGIAIDSLETLSRSAIQTSELSHPVFAITPSSLENGRHAALARSRSLQHRVLPADRSALLRR